MLRLERAAGFEIPVEIEAAMLENSRRLSNNASGIFLEDVDPRDPATWYIHSYRETHAVRRTACRMPRQRPRRRVGPPGDRGDEPRQPGPDGVEVLVRRRTCAGKARQQRRPGLHPRPRHRGPALFPRGHRRAGRP